MRNFHSWIVFSWRKISLLSVDELFPAFSSDSVYCLGGGGGSCFTLSSGVCFAGPIDVVDMFIFWFCL